MTYLSHDYHLETDMYLQYSIKFYDKNTFSLRLILSVVYNLAHKSVIVSEFI